MTVVGQEVPRRFWQPPGGPERRPQAAIQYQRGMTDIDPEVFRFTWRDELTMLARVLLAASSGAVIGYERRRSGKAAGGRTLMLVSMGAALYTLVSIYGFTGHDPSRVAAQIVTGIGFLGAGTIIQQGLAVKGLTTAAAIWVAAAVGMAAGAGLYVLAVATTVLATVVTGLVPEETARGERAAERRR